MDKILQEIAELEALPLEKRVDALNKIREALHAVSPFKTEPVDLVRWVKAETVTANDYNPNSVAPPEMKLLQHSIAEDGYTQPIVSWEREDSLREVVDGFHRHRVGKECPDIQKRIHGYLPVVTINADRLDKTDRMASTIRHNRARGKHKVEAMSDIVVELKRRNWSDEKIAKNLGMDQDEILRLCQITGLAELFSDSQFSKSWDVEGEVTEADFKELTDDVSTYGEEKEEFRTVNTSDEQRMFHTYDKWECYKAGFYATTKEGMTKAECEEAYRQLLSDTERFAAVLEKVITEWKYSCEHYLTNAAMNRIAWLGQAACCYALGIPATYRGGFSLLSELEQSAANEVALKYLNKWLVANGRPEVTMEVAYSGSRQSDIY
jgi:ParB-like chromosome segregation protein Spo0J